MSAPWQDLVRAFRRGPFVSLVILGTVAVGVAINTATLSLAHAMLYRPLPFPGLDRLVEIRAVEKGKDRTQPNNQVGESYHDHIDYRRALQSVEHYGFYFAQTYSWTSAGEPRQLFGAAMDGGFFPALGIRAHRGRLPTAEETAGAAKVAVISHNLWQREFHGRDDVIGRTITLNDTSHEIIGVLPRRAELPLLGDVWTPFVMNDNLNLRSFKALGSVLRLKPGATIEQVQAELTAAGEAQAAAYPAQFAHWRPWIFPLVATQLGGNERTAVILQAAALLLLVMATFNMGALIYAQAAQRSQETAVRLSLGAPPGRLIRLALGETLALVAPGILLGLLAAWLAVPHLATLTPNPNLAFFLRELTVQPGIAAASGLLALALGVLAAALPARQHLGVNVAFALRESTRGGGLSPRVLRLQRWLVRAQLAITVVLLTGAAMLGLSYLALRETDQGYRTDGRVAVTFALSPTRYGRPEQAHRLARNLQDRLPALPGFHAAAVATNIPVGDTQWVSTFGALPRDAGEINYAAFPYARVTEGFIGTMGLRLQRGRDFSADDTAGKPLVVIVSESIARRFWPGREAVGETLVRRRGGVETRLQVVGVVADVKIGGSRAATGPIVLQPMPQVPPSTALTVIAHTALGEAAAVEAVKRAVWAADPLLPVTNSGSLADRIDATAAVEGFQTRVLGALGGFAVLITLMGVSGLVLRIVTARETEFAVRQALGATPAAVGRMVLLEQLQLVAGGALAGAGISWLALRAVPLPLFGLTADSPAPYLLALGLLFACALASLAWPVWRAARTAPARMLRA